MNPSIREHWVTAITWESEESRLKEPWKSSLSAFAQYERFEPEILALRSPVSPMNVTLLKRLVALVPTGTLLLGSVTMAALAHLNKSCYKIRWPLAVAAVSFLWTVPLQIRAVAEDDVFQLAVNYIFAGRTDPQDPPEIVDRKSCIVVVFDSKFRTYIRYYLNRFRMDSARISKTYSGQQIFYVLEIEGDDIVVEHLNPDKTTVARGFKSAQISLPGNIDQSEKALRLIFADYCRAEKPKSPF